MKILIAGAKGQLGSELLSKFGKKHQVVPTDSSILDITNTVETEKVIGKEKPDWILNSAAYTDVEGAAKDEAQALKVNAIGAKNLALTAKKSGAKVVYISSNEVFDGKQTQPYIESDQTKPINPYGRSKLQGENYTKNVLPYEHIIIRTSWLYGPGSKNNFPNKITAKALKDNKLSVVGDEVAVPTYTVDLADWILELVNQDQRGIFNLVNDGSASRYDWAKQILQVKEIDCPIEKAKLSDYERLSTPPLYSVLSNLKAKALGIKFRNWQEASREYLEALDS